MYSSQIGDVFVPKALGLTRGLKALPPFGAIVGRCFISCHMRRSVKHRASVRNEALNYNDAIT